MRVAVVPEFDPVADAVRAGGGEIGPPESADAIVWMSPGDPAGLRAALEASPARWVQLPMAGIEPFVDAGVVDTHRTWTCAKGLGGYGPATAELALALILMAARRLHRHAAARSWGTLPQETHLRPAEGTTVIVGTGGIGSALGAMLAPLGARVLAVSRSGAPVSWARRTEPAAKLPDVAAEADWLVIAAAMTPQTRHLIGEAVLSRMKPTAWLVNVARGGLVDTDALVRALREGRIGGAALDVTDPEPLPDDHPLWSLDDVVITSHTANTTRMAIPELCALVERNVRAFASGLPLEGVVDPVAGY